MIVELLASTVMTNEAWYKMQEAGWIERPFTAYPEKDPDNLAEFAGRLCYQSWDRPNPATATNEGYLNNIICQQHFSVLEHSSATFYIAEVSRSLSHELVRHRHLSFSQVSQRYVDEVDSQLVYPPQLPEETQVVVNEVMPKVRMAYMEIVVAMTNLGFTRKQARQAARAVMPNAIETKLVVSGNMRAWREVIQKRISPAADAEIRELAKRLLSKLKMIAPNTFQDIEDEG